MSGVADIAPAAGRKPEGADKPAGMDERSKARLQKAVREFESMFVGYMLKSMRASMSSEEMFGDSFGGDITEGMFDMELARQMSRNSNFGVGEMLYRKITGEQLPKALPRSAGALPPPVLPSRPAESQPESRPAESPAGVSPVPAEQPADVSGLAPGSPLPVKAEPVSPRHVQERIDQKLVPYEPIILEAAEQHSVSANLLKAVIASESSGNARARSPKNAKGLMQLIDTTAAELGVRDVWDPRQNIFGGAKYLQQLLERFGGNLEQAVASYNAGPGAVEKHGGVPPYRETRAYVARVMDFLHHFEQQEGDTNVEK